MFDRKINVFLICLVFLIFISISVTFAADNENLTVDEIGEANQKTDIYFDASAVHDGDGSKENPYKELTSKRIVNNSNIHLAEGEYVLNTAYNYTEGNIFYSGDTIINYSLGYSFALYNLNNVSFYGQSSDKTIIHGKDNCSWNFNTYLSLNNLTFVNNNIIFDGGNLCLSGVTFKDSSAHYWDNYGNKLGGAITVSKSSDIEIYNSKFINTSSEYGGAIYINGGSLKIVNTSFINSTSSLLGGALYCAYCDDIFISKSRFNNVKTDKSDGGAIYAFYTDLNIYDVNFTNCFSGFGGGICALYSHTSINNSSFENNTANYSGGAIFAELGELNITNSNFVNNSLISPSIVINSINVNLKNNNFASNSTEILAYFTTLDLTSNNGLSGDNAFSVNEFSFNRDAGDYTLFNFNLTEFTGDLPEYYSLVDDGYVSPVKNQKNGGNCWAFTAMSVLESCILKLTGNTYDLSEQNLKNLMALFSNYGWNSLTNDGGKVGMTTGYLSSWLGPVLDSSDKYSDRNFLSNVFDAIFHIDNIILLQRDNFTDNDAVKRAVLTYGAVGGDLCYLDDFLNNRNNAYYCNGKYSSNHAITIVGWDDTYSKNNFLTAPDGDGAWIVKNSWGPDWGDNGYFYVSYYDESVSHGNNSFLYTILLNNTRHYDKIYQYDTGYSSISTYITDSFSYKNVFTITGEEYLAAVSTYFFTPVDWTVSIYINDTFIMNKTGKSDAGYYTFDLDKLIKVNKGDILSVVFKQSVENGHVMLPVMESKEYSKNLNFRGVSFVYNGGKWVENDGVLCIKALTMKGNYATIQLNITNSTIKATVKNAEGKLLNEGNVIFKINDDIKSADIINGVASLEYDFTHMEYYEITATLNATGYNNVSVENTIYHKLDINLTINNTNYSEDILLNITLNDDVALNNNVTVKIKDKTYNFAVSNKTAVFKVPDLFNVGNYTANLIYTDHFNNINKNVSFKILKAFNNINLTVNSVYYPDNTVIYVKADVDGIYTVKINETSVNVTVNNGIGFKEILLNVGNYTAAIIWKNDNYEVNSNIVNFNVLKQSIDMTLNVKTSYNSANINVTFSRAINDDVIINVSGEVYKVNVTGGFAYLNIDNLVQGDYEVYAIFNNSNYDSIVKNQNFTISSYTSQMDVDFNNITVGETLTITVKITSKHSQKPTGNVTLYAGGSSSIAKLNGDTVKFRLSKLSSGNYSFSVVYSGDDIYSPNSYSSTFSVLKVKPNITISDSISYGGNIDFKLSQGMTGNLLIYLNNNVYSLEIISSDFYVPFDMLDIGTYEINISFAGDEKYLPLDISKTLTVSKSNIVVSASSVTTTIINIINGISYSVTLKDVNNNVLAGKNIVITFDGKKYPGITNSKGVSTFKLYASSSGFKSLLIRFDGDDYYNSLSVTKTVSISKVKTSLKVPNKSYKKSSKSKKLKATLKDASGKAIKNAKLVFKVKSKKYTAKTNSKGEATVKVKLTKKGSYKVSVSFSGNSKYFSVSKSAKLKIK